MKRYLLIALVSAGFAGTANAQTPGPADLEAIGNNLGPTVNALADGLGDTANTLLSTQSAVQTSAALGSTVVSTAGAALNGSPNLGALGLLVLVNNLTLQQTFNPYLTAIDDPTAANIQAALAPEDLETILVNLETTPRALLEGSGFSANGNGLRSGAINLLRGRLLTDTSENAVRDVAANGIPFAVLELTSGTNLAPLGFASGVNGLGVATALAPAIEPLDPVASQLADAGAPLTAPVIGILEAGF